MEFASGFQDATTPGDAGLVPISLQFQDMDLTAGGFLVRETVPEANAGENAELYLRHIWPTAVLGVW